MNVTERCFSALIGYLTCNEPIENVKNLIDDDVLKRLYVLSKKHDLSAAIGYALIDSGLLKDASAGAKEHFEREVNLATMRLEQLEYELNVIRSIFNENSIDFIPLKGSVLRAYYKNPIVRTSCDIDILIRPCCVEKAVSLLDKKCGYTRGVIGGHDVKLDAPSGVHIELHFSLVESDKKVKNYLDNAFKNAILIKGSEYALSGEDFYLYHVYHTASHFKLGGCGIRPFVDTIVMKKSIQANEKKLAKMLVDCGLFAFYNAMVEASNEWFIKGEESHVSTMLKNYVFYSGMYGGVENGVAVERVKKSKISYIFSRIFLPYDRLKFRYPVIVKHKILTPFCQIHRLITAPFKRGGTTKSELNALKNLSNEKLVETRELFNALGL